jgi:iron complex outermembrane receptor protein
VLGEARNTFDLDFQHQFAWGERQTLIWGVSYREITDHVRNSLEVALQPIERSTSLYGAFVQDEIALVKKKLTLTLGTRFEHNDFTNFEVQPNLRLLWNVDQKNTLWAAVSRAVRTPSRAEHDFRLTFPGVSANVLYPTAPALTVGIHGSQELDSEKSTSFEAGYRTQLTGGFGVELSLFHNEYKSLRGFAPTNSALDFTKSPVEIIVAANNDASGETDGGELSASWRLAAWCRLSANYSLLHIRIHADPNVKVGSFGATSIEGTSPQQQAALRAWMDLSHGLEFDTALRYVDELPALNVPAYLGLDLRLGWRISKKLDVALVGQNLLDSHHPEFKPNFFLSQATEVRRSIYGKITIEY